METFSALPFYLYVGSVLFCQHLFEDWSFWGIVLFAFAVSIGPMLLIRKFTRFGKNRVLFLLTLSLISGTLIFIIHQISKVQIF